MDPQQEKGALYKTLLILCVIHFSLMSYKNFTESRVRLNDVNVTDLFRSAASSLEKNAKLTQTILEFRKQQRRRTLRDYGLIHGLLSVTLRATASDDDVFDVVAGSDQEARDAFARPRCSGRNASVDPHLEDAIALSKTLVKEIEGLAERYLTKIRSGKTLGSNNKDIGDQSDRDSMIVSNPKLYEGIMEILSKDGETFALLFQRANRRALKEVTFTRLAAEFELHLNLTLFPPVCPDEKALICDFRQSDVISQVHRVVYCMVLAVSTGRALALRPKWPWRSCVRDDVSAESLQFNDGADNPSAAVADLYKTVPVAVDADKGRFPVWAPPLSEILENRILNRVRLLHPEPEVWAAGHVVRYVLDQLVNDGRLASEQKTVNFKSPIAGVYIGQSGNTSLPLAGYLSHVQQFFQNNLKNLATSHKRVLLVSRDAQRYHEAKRFARNFTILHRVNKIPRESAGIMEVYDLYLLSRCHYLVCNLTLAPCRMAFELMNSLQGDVTGRFQGLGGRWSFLN
ncbi:hypothetical protein Btru_014062 [Bulinus truncatus]|nr:hypothetical protein Btru_014062 [Bulinus truncatus]